MMVILSQKEYNALLTKGGNADILAEEKLSILKKDLHKKLCDRMKVLSHTPYGFELAIKEIVRLLCD